MKRSTSRLPFVGKRPKASFASLFDDTIDNDIANLLLPGEEANGVIPGTHAEFGFAGEYLDDGYDDIIISLDIPGGITHDAVSEPSTAATKRSVNLAWPEIIDVDADEPATPAILPLTIGGNTPLKVEPNISPSGAVYVKMENTQTGMSSAMDSLRNVKVELGSNAWPEIILGVNGTFVQW